MKYILLASVLSTAAFAAPMAQQGQGNANAGTNQAGAGTAGTQTGAGQQQQGQAAAGQTQNTPTGGTAAQQGQTPTAGDLATAVSNWQADTSMVSNFLNTGASIQNNVAFKQAATVAFNAEVDELNHKAIIDAANANQPNVISANSTLATGGAFQDVVDKLQIMSQQGRAAVANIDLINQNRCVNVLPNIDAYMASTGSTSQAVRPDVCDQTGVAGGVQGAGPTLPGDAPGTPQAAFDAAAAIANGGNGQVQNTGTPAQTGGANGAAGAQAGQQQQGGAAAQQAGGATGQQAGGAQAQQGAGAGNGAGAQAQQGAGNGAGAQAQQGAGNGAGAQTQQGAGAANGQQAQGAASQAGGAAGNGNRNGN